MSSNITTITESLGQVANSTMNITDDLLRNSTVTDVSKASSEIQSTVFLSILITFIISSFFLLFGSLLFLCLTVFLQLCMVSLDEPEYTRRIKLPKNRWNRNWSITDPLLEVMIDAERAAEKAVDDLGGSPQEIATAERDDDGKYIFKDDCFGRGYTKVSEPSYTPQMFEESSSSSLYSQTKLKRGSVLVCFLCFIRDKKKKRPADLEMGITTA